jgi:CRP/FNR family transcriptional regulator, cyclic AMP receptor protein
LQGTAVGILDPVKMLAGGLDYVHVAGIIAACLVFSCFYMRTMVPLRWTALASNVASLVYSVPLGPWPFAILHGALLPLNLMRLLELRSLVRRLRTARAGTFDINILMQVTKKERFPAGHVMFGRGDKADKAYCLAAGRVAVPAYGVELDAGDFFGAIGVFMPDNLRPSTMVCVTEVEVFVIDTGSIVAMFAQEPGLAVHLLGLACARMNANVEHFRAR